MLFPPDFPHNVRAPFIYYSSHPHSLHPLLLALGPAEFTSLIAMQLSLQLTQSSEPFLGITVIAFLPFSLLYLASLFFLPQTHILKNLSSHTVTQMIFLNCKSDHITICMKIFQWTHYQKLELKFLTTALKSFTSLWLTQVYFPSLPSSHRILFHILLFVPTLLNMYMICLEEFSCCTTVFNGHPVYKIVSSLKAETMSYICVLTIKTPQEI